MFYVWSMVKKVEKFLDFEKKSPFCGTPIA
jgi:hypothetical protein